MTDSSNQQIISKTAVNKLGKDAVKEVMKDVTKDSVIIAGNDVEKEAVKEAVKEVVKEVVNSHSIHMDTADDAIELTRELYDKVYSTLQYMSSMTNKVNRFDRITNQEIHIVSKLHRFLNETLMEIKENPSAGEDIVCCVLGMAWCVCVCCVVCCVCCVVCCVECVALSGYRLPPHLLFLFSTHRILMKSMNIHDT
jgi:hypothetical protein